MKTLDQFHPGDKGTVSVISGSGAFNQRLREMGIMEGCVIEVVRLAPFGDPIEILVQGYNLSLRKHEASFIEVEHG